MLVITRKVNETVHAGPVSVTVCRIEGNKVRLGIDAPPTFGILRGELLREDPGDNMTFDEILERARQPGFRDDKEELWTCLSAAISLLADAM